MPISKVPKLVYDSVKFNKIKEVVDANFNGRFSKLTNKITRNIEDVITTETGHSRLAKNLLESFTYPVLGLPRDILDFFARKLGAKMPRSVIMEKINKWKPLVKYRRGKEAQQAERALRGLYEKFSDSNEAQICSTLFDGLNKRLAPNVARYNTRDGEGLKRLVTGLMPVPFLFRDSFYISKKNNASDDEAKKQAWNKANQELIAAGGETLSQFTILGGASRFINGSQIAAPAINTAIGIGFHIISRLRTGRKLTHVSKKQVAENIDPSKIKSLNDFKKYAAKKENLATKEPKKDGKKRLLTFKNLMLFAATSIVGGFALAMGKNKALEYLAKEGSSTKRLPRIINKITGKYETLVTEDIFASGKSIEGLVDTVKENCSENLINSKLSMAFELLNNNEDKVFLGTIDRVVKLPLVNLKVQVKKLIELPFIPIRMLFEIASYPYKIAKVVFEQAVSKLVERSASGGTTHKISRETFEKIGLLSKRGVSKLGSDVDNYNVLQYYNKYTELMEKHKGNPAAVKRAFKKSFSKDFVRYNDLERSSKIDNSKIGKLTQLLGMVGGIYFATNDDYNQTLLETGSVRKAQVDQRRRGVQKFTRVTTGVAISDWFNQTFVRNYNNSLLGTVAVVAASTFAVDKVTRFVLGQPSKKLTDEELKEFEKQKKNGFMAPFYKFMDRLAK